MRTLVAVVALAAAGAGAAAPGEAAYELARAYSGATGEKLDADKAFAYLRQAAAEGHTGAQVQLAFVYFNGNDRVPKDLGAAYRWFREAADKAVIAQCMLGDFHRFGWGNATRDPAEAFHWYLRAATQDDRCAPKA